MKRSWSFDVFCENRRGNGDILEAVHLLHARNGQYQKTILQLGRHALRVGVEGQIHQALEHAISAIGDQVGVVAADDLSLSLSLDVELVLLHAHREAVSGHSRDVRDQHVKVVGLHITARDADEHQSDRLGGGTHSGLPRYYELNTEQRDVLLHPGFRNRIECVIIIVEERVPSVVGDRHGAERRKQ